MDRLWESLPTVEFIVATLGTPKTGLGAGILHKNSVALAQRGPGVLLLSPGAMLLMVRADGEPTGPCTKPVAQPPDVCSAATVNDPLLTYAIQLAIG